MMIIHSLQNGTTTQLARLIAYTPTRTARADHFFEVMI